MQSSNKDNSKKTKLSAFMIMLLIPAMILITYKMGIRQYYLTSLMVIIMTMVPFFMSFEQRKPQAREVVIIAVLTAMAVASRAAFSMLPHFKPLIAIVIISGIALGGEAGFLVGSLSGFLSNFIFGQGPWTPFQMFAYGIAGFLAGVIFAKKDFVTRSRNKKDLLKLSFFGYLMIQLFVGPLLDICGILTLASVINLETIGAMFISGLPVNFIHGLATFIFLYVLARPLLEKIDRVKTKYGILK
ncbi:MAG: ECF transporter S component [Eubacteriaceae bacterium]|nr:ECF transporter S component [Eubacteriaceae bacterium]